MNFQHAFKTPSSMNNPPMRKAKGEPTQPSLTVGLPCAQEVAEFALEVGGHITNEFLEGSVREIKAATTQPEGRAILEAHVKSPSWVIRGNVARAFGERKDGLKVLEALSHDDDWRVRWNVAHALMRRGDGKDLLNRLGLRDPDLYLRAFIGLRDVPGQQSN